VAYGAGAHQLPAVIKEKIASYKNNKRNIAMYPIMVRDSSVVEPRIGAYISEQARYRRRTLSELRAAGINYLLIRKDFVAMYQSVDEADFNPVIQKRIQSVKKFYHSLFSEHTPIIKFIPDFWHKGPEIYIYKLNEE
jgi:hypothetical protein